MDATMSQDALITAEASPRYTVKSLLASLERLDKMNAGLHQDLWAKNRELARAEKRIDALIEIAQNRVESRNNPLSPAQ